MLLVHDEAAMRRYEDDLAAPRKTLRACLLLLLEERPGHGYDLLTRLEPLGFDRSNPGRVYRSLRWLEGAGFVEPTWETTGVGPARRVYEVTPGGKHALEVSAPALRRQLKPNDDKMSRYMLGRLRTLSNTKQPFEFVVEARVSVQASDEVSARRKLERAFAQPRVLDADVRATRADSVLPADAAS